MCHRIIYDVNVVTGLFVIIEHVISAPVYGREVVYGLNAIYKRFLFQLMPTVQLLGARIYDTQMIMNTGTCTSDVILAREFQKHLSNAARNHGVIDQGKYKKGK